MWLNQIRGLFVGGLLLGYLALCFWKRSLLNARGCLLGELVGARCSVSQLVLVLGRLGREVLPLHLLHDFVAIWWLYGGGNVYWKQYWLRITRRMRQFIFAQNTAC